MKVYFISGLGADRRVFKNIQLPPHYLPVYLDWIPPLKNETLTHYALRLAKDINPNESFSLVGLSLGGMMAVEIASRFKPVHTILISSIPSSTHLPKYYRLLGKLQLHKFLPVSVVKQTSLIKRLFSAKTKEDKKMLESMIRNMDVPFMRWALGAVLNWQFTNPDKNVFHIHGTYDEILPVRFTKPTHFIRKGGHLMVLNRAAEINQIIQAILKETDER